MGSSATSERGEEWGKRERGREGGREYNICHNLTLLKLEQWCDLLGHTINLKSAPHTIQESVSVIKEITCNIHLYNVHRANINMYMYLTTMGGKVYT